MVGGSSSVAGPIFTVYLLASDSSAPITRGGILVVTTAVSLVTVGALALGDALGTQTLVRSLVLIPPNALGIWMGARLFGHSSEIVYRRVALGILLVIGAAAVVV